MSRYIYLIVLTLIIRPATAQDLQGVIYDQSTKKPLPYISIGITGKSVGTLSTENGTFSFRRAVLDKYPGDTLKISGLGYKTKVYRIAEGAFVPAEIFMEPEIIILPEVIVGNFREEKILGTRSESKNVVTGWSSIGSGGERGIKIDLGKKKALLKTVSFFISQNKYSQVYFRIHIRSLSKDQPGAELIRENIISKTSIPEGWVNVDVQDQQIVASGDIMVSVEVIRVTGTCQEKPCLLFSGKMLKGTLYAKEAAQGVWQIKHSFSPGIYLTALYP